jgi:hypothetical protein
MVPMQDRCLLQARRVVPRAAVRACCVGSVLALLIVVALAAIAQEQVPSDIRKSITETPATPQALAPPALRIASENDISISKDLRTRIRTEADTLQLGLAAVLGKKGLTVVVAAPDEKDGKYIPPSDDEIGFAELGIGAEDVIKRVEAGYGGFVPPLAIMTLSERGGHVIAAAYLFVPDADKKFRRVSRIRVPVGDVDRSMVANTWPACFAEAIVRQLNAAHAAVDDPKCQQAARAPAGQPPAPPQQSVAAPQQAQPPAAPQQVQPAAPPQQAQPPAQQPTQRPAAAATKPGGMLDESQQSMLEGIPEKPGVVVVPPPAPPAPAPGPPLQISPPAQTGSLANPGSNNPPVLAVGPPPRADSSASQLSPGPGLLGAELWDQIYAYGFLWRPSDPGRIVTYARHMLQRKDQVGACLRTQRGGFLSEDGLIQAMVDDFRDGFPGVARRSEVGENRYLINLSAVASISNAQVLRSCGVPRPLNNFIYSLRTTSTFTLEAAEAEVAKLKGQSLKIWRLPTPLEGFAVATALYFEGERGSFSFWTSRDRAGPPTVIALTKGGREVDLHVKPAKSDRAYLVLVQ